MKDKTIAILENRAGEQMAALIRKYGGTPIWAPALAEVPDVDPAHIAALFSEWELDPPAVFVFQTGVGVKALFAATDRLGLSDQMQQRLAAACVVVRGPKPTAALRARNVRIDLSAKDPYTTVEVLQELDARSLSGEFVVVQRYGETNWELQSALQKRGARVVEIATYRWNLPEDCTPLSRLIDALEQNSVDVVAFTSAVQAGNLFAFAATQGRREALKSGLNRSLVASIGPVCSAALNKLEVRVDIEPQPPKLGPFVNAINDKLSAP
jgi:uroporphyrinogen-III synthase